MLKLIEYKVDVIKHGDVLSMPGKWPYESYVDFMVFYQPEEERPFGLIVSSGYKAGLILVKLPNECLSPCKQGIDRNWLIKNWANWIYPECSVNDVYVTHYQSAKPVDDKLH